MKSNLITSAQIYEQWKNWKETGIISDQMAKMMLEVARKITGNHRFCGYDEEMKRDMVQEAVLKIIKNLKNMKEEHHDSFFGYWSMTVYSAFYNFLNKWHKEQERKKQLTKDTLLAAELQNYPIVQSQIIKDYLADDEW